uniref:Protein kinase domain-containing protein n=1 Tax=Macrostomum lignano TaxID=282301 RepID=A0A1I8IXY6_9PLAT
MTIPVRGSALHSQLPQQICDKFPLCSNRNQLRSPDAELAKQAPINAIVATFSAQCETDGADNPRVFKDLLQRVRCRCAPRNSAGMWSTLPVDLLTNCASMRSRSRGDDNDNEDKNRRWRGRLYVEDEQFKAPRASRNPTKAAPERVMKPSWLPLSGRGPEYVTSSRDVRASAASLARRSITQGEDGDKFLRHQVGQYINKGSFGELALMYNAPRMPPSSASHRQHLEDGRDTFRRLVLKKAPEASDVRKRHRLRAAAQAAGALRTDEHRRLRLNRRSTRTACRSSGRATRAIEMYFIEDGESANQRGHPGRQRGEGSVQTGTRADPYFGELALLYKDSPTANVYAAAAGAKWFRAGCGTGMGNDKWRSRQLGISYTWCEANPALRIRSVASSSTR